MTSRATRTRRSGRIGKPTALSPAPGGNIQLDLWALYRYLFEHFGPQHWWPAETPFEVMVGAILTQNAAWSNVERALDNIKSQAQLDPHSLLALPIRHLERLIRPSGFFHVKARRLRNFLEYFVAGYQGQVARMGRRPLKVLQAELLRVNGIGPETRDSILLYALGKPCFVVDAYTRRVLARHRVVDSRASYDQVQALFEQSLPRDARLYGEYHALLVRLAKTYCRTRPRCSSCPLTAPAGPGQKVLS